MTPTFCWVFLLALVGRAASMPQPLVVDACALICNPGAETESERERDPALYPRYPKVDCKLQSDSQEHQAWVLTSNCLKLCNRELSVSLEVNCFALRSSLGANLGCYCEALTPLSPNTIRLNDGWKMEFLVKELANDILTTISDSPLDMVIICEIHQELLNDTELYSPGKLGSCYPNASRSTPGPDLDVQPVHGIGEPLNLKQRDEEHHGQKRATQDELIPVNGDEESEKDVQKDEELIPVNGDEESEKDVQKDEKLIPVNGDEESEKDVQKDEEKKEEEVKQFFKEEDKKPAEDEKDESVVSVNGDEISTDEENDECEFCLRKCERPNYRGTCNCEFMKFKCAKYLKKQVS